MNIQSGIFTSPRNGKYYFSLSGLAFFSAVSSSFWYYTQVSLFKNGDLVGSAYADAIPVASIDQWKPFSLQTTLNLQAGDEIWVQIQHFTSGVYLLDNGNHYTHFNGFLLEEDISLNF